MIGNLGEFTDLDPIAFQPARDHEQIDIRHAELLAQHPGAFQIVLLNLGKAIAHIAGDFLLHGGNGLLVIGPAAATATVGMGDMHGGGEEAVDLLHAGQQERVVQRRQFGIGEALRHIEQQGWGLGQGALLGDKGRHPPFGVDGKIRRITLLPCGEVDETGLERGICFQQGNLHGHGTSAGSEIEGQIGHEYS